MPWLRWVRCQSKVVCVAVRLFREGSRHRSSPSLADLPGRIAAFVSFFFLSSISALSSLSTSNTPDIAIAPDTLSNARHRRKDANAPIRSHSLTLYPTGAS